MSKFTDLPHNMKENILYDLTEEMHEEELEEAYKRGLKDGLRKKNAKTPFLKEIHSN